MACGTTIDFSNQHSDSNFSRIVLVFMFSLWSSPAVVFSVAVGAVFCPRFFLSFVFVTILFVQSDWELVRSSSTFRTVQVETSHCSCPHDRHTSP